MALFCLCCELVCCLSLSEVRHHVLREQLHRMENSLLWHSTPIEHHHQMLEADRRVFANFFNAAWRIAENGERIELLDGCGSQELAKLGKGLVTSNARLNPLTG